MINRGGLLIIKIDNTKQKLAFSFDIYIEVLLCIQNRKKN